MSIISSHNEPNSLISITIPPVSLPNQVFQRVLSYLDTRSLQAVKSVAKSWQLAVNFKKLEDASNFIEQPRYKWPFFDPNNSKIIAMRRVLEPLIINNQIDQAIMITRELPIHSRKEPLKDIVQMLIMQDNIDKALEVINYLPNKDERDELSIEVKALKLNNPYKFLKKSRS